MKNVDGIYNKTQNEIKIKIFANNYETLFFYRNNFFSSLRIKTWGFHVFTCLGTS